MKKSKNKHFFGVAIGVALGAGVGVALDLIYKNGTGVAIGAGVGVALGAAFDLLNFKNKRIKKDN
jgi:hypothetical protein